MSEELEHWTLPRLKGDSTSMFGELHDGHGTKFCCTVERPWLNNQHGVSCIPAGTYTCKRRWSAKHGCEVFEVTGVRDRSDIEIHPANLSSELLGCIAPGQAFGEVHTTHGVDGFGVTQSRAAFDALMAHFKGVDQWLLTITDPPGVSHAG